MALIKVGDIVINTDRIVAVELNRISARDKCCVVIMVTATEGLFKRKQKEFWFDGEAANQLQQYFADCNHVMQLLPSANSQPRTEVIRQLAVSAQPLVRHSDFEPEETTNWDDELLAPPEDPIYEYESAEDVWNGEGSDPPDDPPNPLIRRRLWKPRPPDPLSAAASVESFNPPIS